MFDGKKVILFAIPGAWTSTCTDQHLPSFAAKADQLKAKGIDIVCTSTNDAYVLGAWGRIIAGLLLRRDPPTCAML